MSGNGERTVLNDRYEIERRIGRGGMADVFVARDLLLDRPVAIKVLFPEFATDPAFVERFRREAQAAANLTHPNIVAVYDWGRAGNTYFMAMEYVPGRTLADVVRSNGPLTAHQASTIAIDVAAALAFAHQNNMVHRDIKPANILIGSAGQVKVADFGIARAFGASVESNLTQAGAVMGTATYFSPEQAQGAQPDPRSDLYSLGIVLYEMVGGRPPFTAENPVGIAYKQVHDAPQPLNQLAPDVPRPFEAIVARLLAKNPDVRYPTAEALRDDLRRFREGQPVQALQGVRGPGAAAAGAAAAAAGATTVPGAVPPTGVMPATTAVARTTMMDQSGAAGQVDYPPYEEDLPRRTGWYVFAALLAVAALVVGGILLFNYLTSDDSSATLTVPDVTNRPLTEATQILIDQGLNPIPEAVPNDEVGDDIVYAQDPLPNTVVKEGDDVRLTFNPAALPVVVPPITGLTLDEANQQLAPLGLRAEVVETREDPNVEQGRIISQDPLPEQEVRSGSVIRVVVSGGAGQVAVPNVRGQTAADAESLLAGEPYRFSVTRVDEPSATIALGAVVRTEPAIGQTVNRGAPVAIFVSSGPEQVTMPNVVGKDQEEAEAELRALQLVPEVSFTSVPFGSPDAGVVISQSVAATTLVNPNTTVRLRVGVAAPPPTTLAPTTTVPPTTVPPTTVPPTTPPPTDPPPTDPPATTP
jgi:eukaryotic-like serine/threonine-protein kinase